MARVDKTIDAENSQWTFDGISKDFESHVRKSVPFYDEGHKLVCSYADFFLNNKNSRIYEIGSSSGTLSRELLKWNINRPDIELIGIDPVADMVSFSKKHTQDKRATFICDDVINVDLEESDLIVAYYTMQFISPSVRQQVFDKIYKSLKWGGAFILFEKVRGPDARFQDYGVQLYNDFKLSNGLDEIEIVHKTRSLKGVLEPYSTQANIDFLKRSGFKDISTIFKYICFEGFVAIK
jgi:tRNA (cmo5U34)-methyltransferase